MPRAGDCKVCEHPERYAIDQAVAENRDSLRATANRHGFSHNTLLRHRDAHLAPALLETIETTEVASVKSARNVLTELAECFEDVWRMRALVRKQLDRFDRGEEFDATPVRLLCNVVAEARSTCQTAVNIQELALDHQRFAAEQAERHAREQRDVAQAFEDRRELLVGELMAGLIEEGADEERAREAAVRFADRSLSVLIASFQGAQDG